ncbi:DHHC palmitoyltransferase-domain-containing protein [Dipodascopsis tothii]|uniref:DHHC palmitoyltransferase-domain-containing protein n=1 Tax=Dipodascopsis tothii TaxID=44089 RepID=UPI0034CD52C8
MTAISYALAVLSDPGLPSREPQPTTVKATWCKKCDQWKPPRAHHCKACKRCVLQMDHHCPWTNNCVGHGNLMHFLRFLCWVDFTCSIVLYYVFGKISELWALRAEPSTPGLRTQIVLVVVIAPTTFLMLFSVGLLTLRVLWSILDNMTTIESWEMDRIYSQIRRQRIRPVEFPYDLGYFENVSQNLGPVWGWLLPWTTSPGNGMTFEVNEQADPNEPWPPADPEEVLFSTPHHGAFYVRPETTPADYDDADYTPVDDSDAFWRKDVWANDEGERLQDFGVDVDAELDAAAPDHGGDASTASAADYSRSDENVPLAVIRERLAPAS